MRRDLLTSPITSENGNYDRAFNDRDSEYNNSEYYYDPTGDMTNDETSHFEDLVQTYMQDVHYTTITQTALNLTYSMVNIGIVMLPFCAYEAGIPIFIGCVLGFCMLSAYISSLLVEMAEDERVRSLEALSERAFGTRGYFMTCVMQLIFSFAIICVTLGEWGSVIPTVIKTNFGDSLPDGIVFNALTDRKFIMIVGSLMALPGCFSRTFSTLSWSSFFTFSTIIVTIAWSLYILFRHIDNPGDSGDNDVMTVRPLWWTTQVIICFSLSFQQKLFFVFNCLRRRSVQRFAPAVKYSHLFVALLYITFGCVCAIHMNEVSNFKHFNYFKDYKSTNESRAVFDITRTIVCISLLFTIPVESLVIVTVWRRFWRRYYRYRKSVSYSARNARSGAEYQPVDSSGITDDDDSIDEGIQRGTRVNTSLCCLEMPALFSTRDTDYAEDRLDSYSPDTSGLRKAHATSTSRQTVSTAGITTNNSVERYLRRVNTFDTPASPSPSYKSNTTDDNLKTISSTLSDSSNGSSGIIGSSSPPVTPTRQPRTVSFQDEATPPRPLSSSMHAKHTQHHNHHSNRMNMSGNMNTSIHLAADSPHLVSQDPPQPRPISSGFSHPPLGPAQRASAGSNSESAYLNDRSSLMSSILGSSVFGDVTADEMGEYHETRSSVGEIEAVSPSRREKCQRSVPILSVWALSLACSIYIYHTVLFTALFITALVTSIFMFLLPSMLYFRLGVKSDFESIPICGVLPNRICMYTLQLLGVLFIVGNFTGLSITMYRNFNEKNTDMHM